MNRKELDRAINEALSTLDDIDAFIANLESQLKQLRREPESIPEAEEIEPNPKEIEE